MIIYLIFEGKKVSSNLSSLSHSFILYLSSTSLYLSLVQAMLMLSSIAFLQLSLEKRTADLEIGFIQARFEGSTVSERYRSTFASSTLSNFFCLTLEM